VFVNYRAGNVRGDVDSTIFFGGPDGFSESRRKDLPAWAPIVAETCDFNDDGYTDLLLVSSYVAGLAQLPEGRMRNPADLRVASLYEGETENPGSYVYLNGPQGFPDRPAWRLPVSGAHAACCADLNRDGYLDLVFSLIHQPDLLILYGTAEGFDAAHAQTIRMERDGVVYDDARFICLADLNNDGWLDLVVPQVSHDRSLILWGGPQGFSMERCQMLSIWHGTCARAADLTGNGYLDLIVSSHQPVRQPPYESFYHTHQPAVEGPHDSFIHIYWNGPAGLREDNRTMLPCFGARSLAVADFNNDGKLDIFATSYHNGRVRDIDSFLYWNRPGRGFSALDRQRIFTHAASQAVAVDFNEDGWVDLAIANHKTFGKHVGDSWVLWNGPDGFVEGRTTNLETAGVHGIYGVDPGNVVDRGPEEYYVSPAMKLPAGAKVTQVSWQAELPAKSWVKAQLRFAGAEAGLASAPWMGPAGPGSWFEDKQAVDAGQFAGQWVQYRLALGATNSGTTPRVTEVTVAYDGAV